MDINILNYKNNAKMVCSTVSSKSCLFEQVSNSYRLKFIIVIEIQLSKMTLLNSQNNDSLTTRP